MEPTRFDALHRSLASRSTRRQLAIGGVVAGLATTLGLRSGSAQNDDPRTCNFELIANVAVGPDAGTTFQGPMTLPIRATGAIDDGAFSPLGGAPATAVGQATGRTLKLRLDLGDLGVIALSGVAARQVQGCRGELNGIFGGPAMGDLGTWTLTRRSSGASGGSSGTPGAEGSNPAATRTPCPPVDCGQTFVLDPDTCECGCAGQSERCGEQCCPGGSICDAPNQSCQCPPGAEICNDACIPPCPPGEALDQTTCQCNGDCGSVTCEFGNIIGQVLDPATCTCVDYCVDPTPYFCGGLCTELPNAYCNGSCFAWEAVNSNPNACGLTCAVCPPGVPCIGGSCQCPFGYSLCPGGCSDLSDGVNCGSCGNVCLGGVCINGACCYPPGQFEACSSDAECCGGICSYDAGAQIQYCIF